MKQCLMIQTQNKKFFTFEKNLPQLIEFSRTFNAEISIVQIQNDVEVLELEELAPAFCEKKSQKAKYKIIAIKLKPQNNRKKIINKAKKIHDYIKETFLKMELVSLKLLKNKFKNYKVTNACLCMHLTRVRKELEQENHSIYKLGAGKYQIYV